ncbi:hypothetical protein NKR23_g9867 [Pleurostoma richardsiae]|uniref:Uncharacterized protein n=1 Tax=Pleurostoma richardsiae TaxID=41990 RepID=A0AA38R5C7_9PEZI|nr:hypothetical protein NKR23_g9867 [Pleurostoma richardsiae]
MLLKPASTLAILAVASQAVAELMPYKPMKMSMSVREMFGVVRRDDSGYQPTQTFCGMGQTCAEACGAGFDMCASDDQQIHCYNPGASQLCCPDGTGNSCDAGFYCTADTAGETWCCPEGLNLAECAAKYGVTGSLVSETPTPTSTSISSTSTSTSSNSSTTSASSTSSFVIKNTTSIVSTTSSCSSTVSAVVTFPAANTTSVIKFTSATVTPTPAAVSTSGAMASAVPAALALLAAAAAFL